MSRAAKQQSPTRDAADQKETVRLDFEKKILEIASQLSALAEVRKDANLAAQTECTLSSLDKLSDDELEEVGITVAAFATTNLAALADYGVVLADVTALSALKTSFHGVKTAPRTAIAGRGRDGEYAEPDRGHHQCAAEPSRQAGDQIQEIQPAIFRRLPKRPRDCGPRSRAEGESKGTHPAASGGNAL